AAGVAVGIVLLGLCGPSGLALVPALALWLGCSGAVYWWMRDPKSKWTTLVIVGVASIAFLIVPLYFLGYHRPAHHSRNPGLWPTLTMGMKLLSQVFHPEAEPFWPYSGEAVLGLLLISTAVLVVVWLRRPRERLRALALFLFLGGACS